jgi:ATP synthase protein I
MTVAILIGALMGYALDYFLGTDPWFLAIGVLFGGAAGVLNVYRAAMEMQKDLEDGDENQDKNDIPDSESNPPDRNHNDFLK